MPPLKPPPSSSLSVSRICWQCRSHLRLAYEFQRKFVSKNTTTAATTTTTTSFPSVSSSASPSGLRIPPKLPGKSLRWPSSFFVSMAPFSRRGGACISVSQSAATTTTTAITANTPPSIDASQNDTDEMVLARRQWRRSKRRGALVAEFAEAAGTSDTNGSAVAGTDSGSAMAIPPDASALLGAAAAKAPPSSLRRTLSALLSLSKPRLTVLVVLTAMAPYALYPSPDLLSPALTETPSLSPLTLLFLTTGTALCSASANALNMLYEPRTDAMMTRTRNRPLVRALISKRTAVFFAVVCAVLGVAGLYVGVNPTVSCLGVANIVLYAGIYTPMKRLSAINTWIGALVGGIPPLMGWAAAAGESATGDGSWRELLLNFPGYSADGSGTVSSAGGWLLASLLFAWQFPHFMALSWPIRGEYKSAGLRMLSWVNPARNARVALRYSLAFFPICVALCASGITEWSFAVTSLPVNSWLAWEAMRFWRRCGSGGTARGLFWASVWHLPAVMVLALLQKKSMWDRVWRSVTGDGTAMEDEEHEWVYLDDEDEK